MRYHNTINMKHTELHMMQIERPNFLLNLAEPGLKILEKEHAFPQG